VNKSQRSINKVLQFLATFIVMRNILVFLILVSYTSVIGQTSHFNPALQQQKEKATSEALNLLVKGNASSLRQLSASYGFQFHYQSGDICSITCAMPVLQRLVDEHLITYAEYIPARKKALNDTMLKRNRIVAVHTGQAPLSQSYDGSGILFGLIDTGIDFNHKDFKTAQGGTRILYLWDQVSATATAAPSPYNYGHEWTAADINANLCTHNDLAYYGHGTHVGGIGAGNGLATGRFMGVAPKADIIAVALDFNRNGAVISDGVKYIFAKAQQLARPCVINISVGDYYGSHDGTDLEAQIIDAEILTGNGRAVVAAAGNAGSVRFHTKTQVQGTDTLFTWIRGNGAVIDYSFFGDTTQVKNLKISIGANRGSFANLGQLSFKNYNYALNTITSDTLKNNGNRIGIVKMAGAVNSKGVYELAVEILADTNNLFWRIETTGQGLHHAWNFSFVGTNLPTLTQYPRISNYVSPDSLYSMVSGFQCSDQVITVANYHNLQYYYDVRDTLHNTGTAFGSISVGSSLGPTRDGRQKPDIAASGQIIFSAGVLSMLPGMLGGSPQDVAQDSMHVIGGGTSAASPIVAGLSVLYFQKNPSASHAQLKQMMTECAYQDSHTGSALPNYQWGYGKLDGKNTLLCRENLVGIRPEYSDNNRISPNPFSSHLTMNFSIEGNKVVRLFDVQGKMVYEGFCSTTSLNLNSGQMNLGSGVFILEIADQSGVQRYKLIHSTCE
jgi:subtilisin family serine protease